MSPIPVSVRRLPHAEGLPLPAYQSEGAAGCDLLAALADPVTLAPGARTAIPTGLQIALPHGYEAQVRPRSGLAARHGVTVTNAPGTIDADYRGEILVLLINLGQESVTIVRGDRIAQLIVAPVIQLAWSETDTLPATLRGTHGFGSTGGVADPARAPARPQS